MAAMRKKVKNMLTSLSILFMSMIFLYGFSKLVNNGSYYLVENLEDMGGKGSSSVNCDKSSVDNNTMSIESIKKSHLNTFSKQQQNNLKLSQLEADLKRQEQQVSKVQKRCMKRNLDQ